MSKTVRNILIVFTTVTLVAVALIAYFYLPLGGLQYLAGKYSSGTEDEVGSAISEEDDIPDKGEDPVDDFEYELVYTSLMVKPGDVAAVKLHGKPSTKYSIEVWYSSGLSSAYGLEDKVSNAEGYVEWTWTVSGNVNPGIYDIYIKDGSETVVHSWIHVME